MTVFGPLTNAFVYMAGHDFTADTNEVTVTCAGDAKDATNFRSGGWKEFRMGLKQTDFNMKGFWQSATADAVDPELFNNLGVGQRVTTVAADETEGQPALIIQEMPATYTLFPDGIGEMAGFTLQGANSDKYGVVRGTLLKEYGVVSATGATGTGVQVGAVSSTKYLYATFHVFGTPGTTITAVIESAAANTFVGATTRITFGPITTAGGTFATPVLGPITDTWWRVRITAITGTFTIASAIGIQ